MENTSSWRHYRFLSHNDVVGFATVDEDDIVQRQYSITRAPSKTNRAVFERIRLIPSLAVITTRAIGHALVFKEREPIMIIDQGEFELFKMPTMDSGFRGVYAIDDATMHLINSFQPVEDDEIPLDQFPTPQLILKQRDADNFLLRARLAVAEEIRHRLQCAGPISRQQFSMDRIPSSFFNYLLQTIPNSGLFLTTGAAKKIAGKS